jgi:hypothetical protein
MSALALGVCLALASSSAGEPVFIATRSFTLAWTHSIEKVRWEEEYEIRAAADGAATPELVAVGARIKGSGAGMEPPADAVLRNGWYEYRPSLSRHDELRLTRSEFTADYEFCVDHRCHPLGAWLPSDGGVTRLYACRGTPSP